MTALCAKKTVEPRSRDDRFGSIWSVAKPSANGHLSCVVPGGNTKRSARGTKRSGFDPEVGLPKPPQWAIVRIGHFEQVSYCGVMPSLLGLLDPGHDRPPGWEGFCASGEARLLSPRHHKILAPNVLDIPIVMRSGRPVLVAEMGDVVPACLPR